VPDALGLSDGLDWADDDGCGLAVLVWVHV
jgi:hypothetical protein